MSGALPRIGIRLSGAIAPQSSIELARAAEAAAFASVWFAENPFQRGVFTAAGACAAATARVRIGTGVVNPYTRHPVQIAMEFAVLDELAEGRAILGLGSGIAPGDPADGHRQWPFRCRRVRGDRTSCAPCCAAKS